MMDTTLGSMFTGKNPGAVLGRTAVASIVGGTASAVGGGKFANGAITVAWQHLLNNEMPRSIAHEYSDWAQYTTRGEGGKGTDLVFASTARDSIDDAVQHIPSDERYVVAGHGGEYGRFIVASYDSGLPHSRKISVADLVYMIRRGPSWRQSDIYLVVCNAGLLRDSGNRGGFASNLAKELKVNVSAASGVIEYSFTHKKWSLALGPAQGGQPLERRYFKGK